MGHQSVANELFTRGKSFGGDTLTTTDVAMVAGVCPPLPSATPPQLEPRVVYAVMQEVHRKLEMLVDSAKVRRPLYASTLGGHLNDMLMVKHWMQWTSYAPCCNLIFADLYSPAD